MTTLRGLLASAFGTTTDPPCLCRLHHEAATLTVDASDCPGDGAIETEPDCRHRVVTALRRTVVDALTVEVDGLERRYPTDAICTLASAARFAERIAHRDSRLADLASRDPLAAATEAVQRAGPVAELATTTGLADLVEAESLATVVRPFEGPSIGAARVANAPPPEASILDAYETETTTVRTYVTPDEHVPTYHVEPLEASFDAAAHRLLDDAATILATGDLAGDLAHHAAVRRAATEASHPDVPVDDVARVLGKHTAGFGVLEDLFADPAVSDVYANAPLDDTVIRATVDDQPMRTNVSLTAAGAATIAARVRAESGQPFSRAAPLVDAVTTDLGVADRVRVAGVTTPVTDGTAFAFRAGDADAWRLQDLVANDTLTPDAAALLGFAVARGRRILVAGPRGAGKTTLLAALLWELPPAERVVVLEDTPELPVAALQADDRDALALRTSTGDVGASVSPTAALRAALRLGDGALVVGEVRGEEAAVLYEAMRVGANSSAVLGTIHGDGAHAVEERVVTDLGVPRSSFAATDLVATVGHTPAGRRLTAIEEVTDDGFAGLYESVDGRLRPTARIRRGDSRVVAATTEPGETYADVREQLRRVRDDLATTRPSSAVEGGRVAQ